ncbi:MAG TPA: thymidine phosphorylase, partial [Pyrinomonadaceae bacterium]|nr:thymidine phosphorylase [Pyrinomonadaceae bacterium]
EKCGFALAGQTDRLVPADRKMYAIRDATATIEYIPLIVASIMSKKIAEGLNALIIDVKAGSGAFMQQLCDAENLAAELVKTGEKFKIKSRALISDMNRPLGKFIGNSVEVYEAVKILKGEKDRLTERTRELSLALTAHLIEIAGLAENYHAAMEICVNALDSGKAFELFLENVKLQGGEPQCVEKPETLLPENSLVIENEAPGFVTEINARKIGEAVCRMGGGRVKAEDRIDHSIGIELIADINDRVEKGDPLCRIFYSNRRPNEKDTEDIRNAFIIEEKAAESTDSLIMKVIS